MTDQMACDAPAPCVLVVDDSPVNLAVAQAMLNDRGASVDIATSAREALERAQKTAYALVFMDVRMAGADGIAATRAIRALGGHCSRMPIVALSADAEPLCREACLAAGMDGFIAKPLDIHVLDAVLQRWCGLALAPVDTTVFTELRVGITTKSFHDVASRFLSEGPQRIARLHAAAAQQDHETVAREAHTLKSAAALFGARPLQSAAAEIERRALRGDSKPYPLAELSGLAAAVCAWLDGRVQESLAALTLSEKEPLNRQTD